MKLNAGLIERYRTCWTAEDIEEEQEKMLVELDEVNRQRRANGGCRDFDFCFLESATRAVTSTRSGLESGSLAY